MHTYNRLLRGLISALLVLHTLLPAHADKGMWLPFLLREIEGEMQQAGLRLSADDIYSINHASLKDAVVRFGGGCTAEVVSKEGLLLTNHHCGYYYLASHSTVQNDRLTHGFWAKDRSEELPCPGLTATFVVRMEDVTRQVLDGITAPVGSPERDRAVAERIKTVTEKAVAGTPYQAAIKAYYYGAEYYMTVTETFTDVRLVGSPPEAVGKFGGDTDNWMWPRHTGDFMVYRIYAGSDNTPAAYSADNVPYRPRHHFPISLNGVKEGDFTMVFGFPGRTEQYLPAEAVRNLSERIDPLRVAIRDERLRIMARYMDRDPATRLNYASEYASVANYWKKWDGEMKGIRLMDGVKAKQAEEDLCFGHMAKEKGEGPAGQARQSLTDAYRQQLPYDLANAVMNEALMSIAPFDLLIDWQKALDANDIPGMRKVAKGKLSTWNLTLEKEMMAAMLRWAVSDSTIEPLRGIRTRILSESKGDVKTWADQLWQRSVLTTDRELMALLARMEKGDRTKLDQDPIYQFFLFVAQEQANNLAPAMARNRAVLDLLQHDYVAALRRAQPKVRFFPDANGTLRLTYGKVEPYRAFDGKTYPVITDLDGIMAKEKPGDKEFSVPERLKELWKNKDYGRYAVNGTVPVAFIASNHTTGGNSGSPLLNADGHLVGINFDRNWEGTKSDVLYDRTQCRNISVDIRYVMFIIDRYAGATHLVDEMTVVQ
jgi:hypothetical protein